MRVWQVMAIGLVLGITTRLEELTPGFFVGLSSSAVWLGVAFAAGGAGRGALALTLANAGYYATAGVYGPVGTWFAVAVLGGVTAGWLGGRLPRWLGVAGVAGVAALEITGAHVTVAGLHLP